MSTLTAHEALLRYQQVRNFTAALCQPLQAEDYVIQSMTEASPAKWHLAHTTWFFEQFILKKYLTGYRPLHSKYDYLFNSYYNAVGVRHCRANRGQISRPTVADVYAYRRYVDDHMQKLVAESNLERLSEIAALLTLGENHEQQHQELILTDIMHVFACNPTHPVYSPQRAFFSNHTPGELQWIRFHEGLYTIGHTGGHFGFDNEFPAHETLLKSFQAASRLTTNGEYIAFMEDGGYKRPEFWLSDGWDTVKKDAWIAPFYWERVDGMWYHMTLNGFLPVDPDLPVCHVSFYEADAYARWAGRRLLSETEWEVAANTEAVTGNLVESGYFHPVVSGFCPGQRIHQMFGDVWEWTASPYMGYPGYRPVKGALGEYNGKFMINQMVLRGGSCATPQSHIRATYRNFFYPNARWQFTGIRIGDDV